MLAMQNNKLAIQDINLEDVLGISALRSVAASWENASLTKRILVAAGMTAAAVGVCLAIGFGIPVHTVMDGLKCGYEVCKLAGQVFEGGSGLLSAIRDLQTEEKAEKTGAAVLPFMTSLSADKEPEILATTAAAA